MRFIAAVLAAFVLPFVASHADAAPKTASATAQFVARLYVEGLGRLPTPREWGRALDDFEAGCSVGKMRFYAVTVLTSAEFLERPYDDRARLLALTRAFFAAELRLDGADFWIREIEATGWNAAASRLAGWIVDACETTDPSVGFQPAAATRLRADNYDPEGRLSHPQCEGEPASSCVLNRLLQEAKEGSRVVTLPQMAVIDVTTPIVVPEGVTLTTEGDPSPRDYATMARLVRRFPFTPDARFSDPKALVVVEQGATVRSVWIDGQRHATGGPPDHLLNVLVMGGEGATVRETVLASANAGAALYAAGQSQAPPSPYAGMPCRKATIARNRITAYVTGYVGRDGRAGALADGMVIFCEDALVEGNEIIDASDAGIALFASLGPQVPMPQKSIVRDNWILAAGNPMLYGIVLDTQGIRPGCTPDGRRRDFDGASIEGNTLMGGPHTHFDTGISVGARILWGRNYPGKLAGLRLARVTGNRIGVSRSKSGEPHTRVGIPIAVAGAYAATVKSNATMATLKRGLFRERDHCAPLNAAAPRRPPIVASVRAGWASGTFDRFADQDLSGCICPKTAPDGVLAHAVCLPEPPGTFDAPDPAMECD